jgi:hypothetical protein
MTVQTKQKATMPAAADADKAAEVAAPVTGGESSDVAPKIVTTGMPVVAGPDWKKRELIEQVAKRSGVKKKDAKLVVDAMLALMGEGLAEGWELIVQPMGRIKATRIKDSANGKVLMCRVRMGGGDAKDDTDPLAEGDD